jgi:hypothetical protein
MADDLNAPIVPTTPTPTPEDHWSKGLDAETVGFLQTRGWDKLDATAVTGEAIKAYRNASKMMGAPPDQLLRLPREDDVADRQAFWRRLGAPEKADDYKFEGLEWEDAEKTSRFAETIRKTAVELNIPKEMAERLAKSFYDWGAKETADGEAQQAISRQGEERELYQSWGAPDTPAYKANEFIVNRAMESLGIDKQTGDALRDQLGLAPFMKMMHRVGSALGEDKFVSADIPAGGGARAPLTREQVASRLEDLKADQGWRDRLFKGEKNAKREFEDLTRALAR